MRIKKLLSTKFAMNSTADHMVHWSKYYFWRSRWLNDSKPALLQHRWAEGSSIPTASLQINRHFFIWLWTYWHFTKFDISKNIYNGHSSLCLFGLVLILVMVLDAHTRTESFIHIFTNVSKWVKGKKVMALNIVTSSLIVQKTANAPTRSFKGSKRVWLDRKFVLLLFNR